jgi:hypothetical protein
VVSYIFSLPLPLPLSLVSPSKLFLSSLCNTKLIVLVTNTARNKVPTIIVIACAFSLPLSSPLKLFNVVTSSTETQRTSSYCHCKYSSSFTPLWHTNHLVGVCFHALWYFVRLSLWGFYYVLNCTQNGLIAGRFIKNLCTIWQDFFVFI